MDLIHEFWVKTCHMGWPEDAPITYICFLGAIFGDRWKIWAWPCFQAGMLQPRDFDLQLLKIAISFDVFKDLFLFFIYKFL